MSRETGLATTTIRVGQISGGENGFWSTTDWVPNLLVSSLELGCLPDAKGVSIFFWLVTPTWLSFSMCVDTVHLLDPTQRGCTVSS